MKDKLPYRWSSRIAYEYSVPSQPKERQKILISFDLEIFCTTNNQRRVANFDLLVQVLKYIIVFLPLTGTVRNVSDLDAKIEKINAD